MEELGEMFDGTLSSAKGVLIGGGITQAAILGVKIMLPAKSKYAGLIGAAAGCAVSAFMMSKPQHREAGQQGLAASLLIGLSRAVEDMALKSMIKDGEFGAYTTDLGAVPGIDIQGPLEIMDAGSGSSGMLGAITNEMGDGGMEISGSAFGATGF